MFSSTLKLQRLVLVVLFCATGGVQLACGQGLSVAGVSPAPGSTVSNLTAVTVTFTKVVLGVQGEDLILNGSSGTNVVGAGAVYTFFFSPPTPGTVEASWNGGHNITDSSGNRLDDLGANTRWTYTLVDRVPPSLLSITPFPSSTLGRCSQITLGFREPVIGVDATDLLINGQPATSVSGEGAGLYTFAFPSPASGPVQISWSTNQAIRDAASPPNFFRSVNWTYTLFPGEFGGDIVINEFLAANVSTNGLRDEDGERSPWIELYNRGANPINLNGWSLTDDPAQSDQWVFPSVTLGPGQYLVVFASGKDRKPDSGNLHTSFKLGSASQYLGLFNANFPRDVATQFLPGYPEQRADISYGLYGGVFGYLTNASPGTANSGPANFTGVVPDPLVSVDSGFFNRSFLLTLSTTMSGATVRYTLDGSEPTAWTGMPYAGPVAIAGSAAQAVINVRAAAFRPDLLSSHVVTRSYIFPEFVLQQPANPPGVPLNWTTQTNATSGDPTIVPADYQMDPRIITNVAYAALAAKGLTNLPTLSIVTDNEYLFSQSSGIYANPNPALPDRGAWERPVSAELLLPDGSSGFRVTAGLRIQGGTSRDPNWTRKHSLRLFFKNAYDGTLKYSLFPDSPAKSFHTLNLKAGFNVSWNDRYEAGGYRAVFVRDQFCSDMLLQMNRAASHGRFVHVYLNGLYWGLYDLHERPDDDFAATYFGGDKSEYDVVRNTDGYFEVLTGDADAWNSMMALVNMNLSDNAQYEQLQQFFDVDSFIDYMILNHYAGNTDWANHNWYAIRRRAPGAGYQFASWDAELTMRSMNENVTGYNQTGSPTMIHSFLRNNMEYRVKFADHLQKLFFNGGPFFVDTNNPAIDPAFPERNRPGAAFLKRINEVTPAVVLESARWGDSVPARASNPYSLNDFNTELSWLKNTFFGQRSGVLLNQYRPQLLFPAVSGVVAPGFSQQGGVVSRGFNLTLAAPRGTIYYTTNGVDPRVYGSGAVDPAAVAYSGVPITLNSSTRIRARALEGAFWSPINDATFSVSQLIPPLRITEIMHQPVGGDTFQFLELQNAGTTPLDLTGWSVSGISFVFPFGFTAAPGAVIVLASSLNPAAFAIRYPGVNVAAYFSGHLAKNGERIAVLDDRGNPIVAVNYTNGAGWPVSSGGASLEINDPAGDPDDPANWRVSASSNGTPGVVTPPPPADLIRINEIMALNPGNPSWIEIINTGPTTSLAGWSLSNDGNARKYVLPPGVNIGPGGFLIIFCDLQTNAPGLHTGFTLNPQGDHLYLYNLLGKRADACSFGPQVPALSIGRMGGSWRLTVSTPNAPNQAATVGPATNIFLNEWLANSAPGQSDWLELYNPSSFAVPLQGFYFGNSNGLFQITSLSFLPPHGYVQFLADELPGPNHLDLKLPADGGFMALYDAGGGQLDRINYGAQASGISQGRFPDGSSNILSFAGSASPGASNFVVSFTGPLLNEIMARNDLAVVDPWGGYSDWVEIYNPGASFDLSGMSLSMDEAAPGQWTFPTGASMPAGGYLTIWCNGSRPMATNLPGILNASQALNSKHGGVYLFNAAGQVVDYVEYGFQLPDKSIGRVGSAWRLLANPTLGSANSLPQLLGNPANVRFNEWMALPDAGDPWFELYNLDSLPVDLTGTYLTDDPSLPGRTKFAVAPLSFIPGRGWVLWDADGHPSHGRDHVNFTLQSWGESLRLYGTDLSLLDAVDVGVQQPGISAGCLPDGGNSVVSFPTTASPAESNYLPLALPVINEVLTHADPPLEDAIELANPTGVPLNIGGWYLSDSQLALQKYRIPDGTSIPANGFKVFYQYQFDPTPGVFPSFSLDSAHGDAVYLSAVDDGGNLTGFRADVRFGAAQNGVSFGRYTNTTGVEFVALSRRTFGQDTPGSLAQFRTGTGLPNAYPKVGPVIINEIMYHPVTVVGPDLVENPDEQFVELYNSSTTNVPLFDPLFTTNSWKISGDVTFSFPSGASLAPQDICLVVSFSPATNPAALAAFRSRFGVAAGTAIYGPFTPALGDLGSVQLFKPDAPSPAPDAGFVPFILVDQVDYLSSLPWSVAAAGGGASLQRRVASAFGNDYLNWKAEAASAGRTNTAAGPAPPLITSQPQSQTIKAGTTATLTVGVSGASPLSYRWQRNGINLAGATNVTLNLINTQPADSGQYRIWVTNSAGSIYSQSATLSVLQPPVITSQPLDLTVPQGTNATFRVVASGSSPLAYQWYFNNSPLPSSTSSALTLIQVGAAQAGSYRVIVTNAAGLAASLPASLNVITADGDGDGIPDWWMLQNFGHATGQAADHSRAQDDPDMDGLTNLQEYRAGTNPLDPQSSLKLRVENASPGGRPRISFTAVAGVSYTLQFCDNLTSGTWYRLRDLLVDPTTRIVQFDDAGATHAPVRFYRVVTPIQPYAGTDTDGDGIPDSWMAQFFGHPTAQIADHSRAQDDADSDGMTNAQEYRAGTDPRDSRSILKLLPNGLNPATGQPQFSFTAIGGIGYTLQYSENPGAGTWNKVRDVSPELLTRTVLLDDLDAANAPVRFYRIATPIQP